MALRPVAGGMTTRALAVIAVALGLAGAAAPARADDAEVASLCRAFRDRTGVALVFDRAALPGRRWFPIMPALASAQAADAARLLLAEARRYPAGWLGRTGLTRIGVFAGLAARRDDGYRWWDDALGGYRYSGKWNGKDAIALGYYSDWQLIQTFHHELHHAIDTASGFGRDDARFRAAIDGTRRYPALVIPRDDLAQLEAWAGWPLTSGATDYAARSPGEDQAETAAWMQQNLATALWQAAAHPEWAGSQRILHVLAEHRAAPSPGPALGWWIDVALGRDPEVGAARRRFAAAARAQEARVRARIAPGGRYRVRGRAGATGNPTLRADLALVAQLARGLGRRAERAAIAPATRARLAARWMALLDGYRADIAGRWGLSAPTDAAFAAARAAIARDLGVRGGVRGGV